MKTLNVDTKGFTLVELIVVITILAIMGGFTSSFLNSVKNTRDSMNEKKEVYTIQSLLDNSFTNNYDLAIATEKKYEQDFQPTMSENNPVYYKIPYLTLALFGNGEKLNPGDAYKDKEITLGFEKCEFLLNMYGNSISGSTFINNCPGDFSLMGNSFNLQGFILGKTEGINIERADFKYSQADSIFGYTYNITNSGGTLIYDETGLKDLLSYKTFDLLLDSPESFYDNQVFILHLKDSYLGDMRGIFYGKIDTLGNKLRNIYIVNHVNNSSNDFTLDKKSVSEIFNTSGLSMFYNLAEDRDIKKTNLINLGINY